MKNFSLETLKQEIFSKKSFLCVGLDVDLSKIPPFYSRKKILFLPLTRQLSMPPTLIPLPISPILLSMKPTGSGAGSR